MTKLTCHVTNCANNCNNCCGRGTVDVDGVGACRCAETKCADFEQKHPGQMNNAVGGACASPISEVKCSADQCLYNNHGNCTASSISIDGNDAQRCGDTRCSSFRAK